MGADVDDRQWLALRIGGGLYFTGCVGHGTRGEHRTGRYAVDVAGLRLLGAGGLPELRQDIGVGAAQVHVLDALAARYGWAEQPTPVAWGMAFVPGRQIGIGIEVHDGALVCLPVIGGPGRHECPGEPQPFGEVLAFGLFVAVPVAWDRWFGERTATERDELRAAVVELRGALT